MTFKHKLSARLALMRDRCVPVVAAVIALAAVYACRQPLTPAQPVTRIAISPRTLSLPQNQTSDFTVVGFTSTGDTASVAVSWSVTSGSITDTSTSSGKHYGRYKAGPDTGKVKVVAHGSGTTDTAAVTVTSRPVASVTVSPGAASVIVGQAAQFTAIPKDANGFALAGRVVTWSSNNTAVATVNASGLATGVAVGSATITATSEGKNGTAVLTVSNVPVASVTVAPASASVPVGQTAQLAATPKDASGTPLSGRVVTWASSNTAVATVNGSGLVYGVAAGAATITATSEGPGGAAGVKIGRGAGGGRGGGPV